MENDGTIDMVAAYKEVIRRVQSSSNFECSYDRFKNLCTECSEIDIGTVREVISALQLEADGVVKNIRRDPSTTQKGFDFLIDGGPPFGNKESSWFRN